MGTLICGKNTQSHHRLMIGAFILGIAQVACNPSSQSDIDEATQESREFATSQPEICTRPQELLAFASYRDGESEIYLLRTDEAEPTRLTDIVQRVSKPVWSPDGQSIAVVLTNEKYSLDLYLIDSDGQQQSRVTANYGTDTEPSWSPSGNELTYSTSDDSFFDDAGFFYYEFDIHAVRIDGTDDRNLTNTLGWDAEPAWSPDGKVIAFQSHRDDNPEIYVMAADGSEQINLTNDPAHDGAPSWSPDGSRIAFQSDRAGDFDIYVMNSDGSNVERLTLGEYWDAKPAWSPKGDFIAFQSRRQGNFDIFVVRADGSCLFQLTHHPEFDGFPDWRP